MKYFALLILVFTLTLGFSQKSNLIIFSQNGENFKLIINGIQQNPNPQTNVKVTDLVAPNYKVRILFDDKNLGFVDKSIYFQTQGNEETYMIKQNNKGRYVIRFQSSVPLYQAPPTPPNQIVYAFSLTPRLTTVTTSTTTITTQTNNNPNGTSMGVSVGDGQNNVNLNLNVNTGNSGNVNTSTSYTETTTTTTTTTGGVNVGYDEQTQPQGNYLPGYTGAIGCPVPMSDIDFNDAKNTIESKDFESSKLTIAKQIANSNCMLSSQVKQIVKLFDFEDSKLKFAKYAYNHTYDISNYYKINDAFEFESSIDELNNYINSQGQ